VVVDRFGNTRPGRPVLIEYEGGGTALSTVTDENGEIPGSLEEGVYNVTVGTDTQQVVVPFVDGTVTAQVGYKGSWTPVTDYSEGDVVTYGTLSYIAPAAHTSGAVFDVTDWDVIAEPTAAQVGYAEQVSGQAPGSGTQQDYPGLIITPIAYDSRPIRFEVVVPLMSTTVAGDLMALYIMEALLDPETGFPGAYSVIGSGWARVIVGSSYQSVRALAPSVSHTPGSNYAVKVQWHRHTGTGNLLALNLTGAEKAVFVASRQ
jgi:hypothetical protein